MTQFPDERLALDLSLVVARKAHLVKAVANGQATDAIYIDLRKEVTAKKALAGRIAELHRLAR